MDRYIAFVIIGNNIANCLLFEYLFAQIKWRALFVCIDFWVTCIYGHGLPLPDWCTAGVMATNCPFTALPGMYIIQLYRATCYGGGLN
jgi:hypothetical protein